MDPLSDVLSLLKLQSFFSGGFEAGGDWSIRIPAENGIKFYAAIRGDCWLAVDGVPEPVHVVAGECLLLPSGREIRVASDLRLPSVDVYAVAPAVKDGRVNRYNGGNDFASIGGNFTLAGEYTSVLIGMLPPIVHIRNEPDKAMLRWCVERMRDELREPQPGGFLVAQQLATLLLVAALRLHLADGTKGGVGWLFALADPHMAAAINAMHERPAERWTLQTLAERVGMSRTSFAVTFKETVGASPIEYLTRWRMMLASDRLANSNDSLAEIAGALGYESESAFSTAFKRLNGCSPRQYGRSRQSDNKKNGRSSRYARSSVRGC
jgi:AraC-like DNA-binding protein